MVLPLLPFPNFDLTLLILKKKKKKLGRERERERLEKVGQTLEAVGWEPV